jgi:putative DNA methylase
MKTRKKLIEVALPLEAINVASAKEKSIRHGHPSTLHLWWARRPLAAARAVIFSQMVDDPSANPDLFPTEKAQEKERQRLFKIIEDMVEWPKTPEERNRQERALQAARDETWQSWRRACADNADHPRAKELFNRYKLPAFHDPFAGGGALPLEAQRLGLEAYASDLNPVAVLINKAMIEVPPRFAGKPPVNPESQRQSKQMQKTWQSAQGLAEDVRYYGQWMRDEAEKRIGHLYPKVEITTAMAKERPDLKPYVSKSLTVIAWLWARTVRSPNPAFTNFEVPLASTFMLCTKAGKEVYVDPIVEHNGYRFTVKLGRPKNLEAAKRGTKSGSSGSSFLCLMSGTPMPFEYLRSEAKAGRIGARLMAIVAEGEHERVYLSPTSEMQAIAQSARPTHVPETGLPEKALGFRVQEYGMTRWRDLFTSRQLLALVTFSDLVSDVTDLVKRDALVGGLSGDSKPLSAGGAGATAYSEALAVYLGFGIDKMSDRHSTLARWDPTPTASGIINTFSRHALPMTWDYAEGNPFSEASGNFESGAGWIAKVIQTSLSAGNAGTALQENATTQRISNGKLVSTDPPYYDNIGYADLSDYFYVWLRRTLQTVFPDLFATVTVPKAEELVATPFRHGTTEKAETFFLGGMTEAMHRLAQQAHPSFPVTIYYAFKQSENESKEGTSSTGWETFLDAVMRAGFAVSGTWPIRTELSNRMISSGTNALASSIVLVCHHRAADASTATRREFIAALKAELPVALAHLQRSNIAPVDLAQAAIGPGMAVYTRYSKVLDASGKPVPVQEALALINQTLDEVLAEQEGDFDADTRWALAWFEQSGFAEGDFGVADTLSKAKNTSVGGMVEGGTVISGRGKVRLLTPNELSSDWDPEHDRRLTVWETVHHLIRALEAGGESAAAALVSKLGSKAETARELAYRLYAICERKKRATEALSYNALVQSWPEIMRLSRETARPFARQAEIFE